MSADRVNITALRVGQGMGTMASVLDSLHNIIGFVLVDLGTDSSLASGNVAIQRIYDELKQMAAPRIEVMVISHQDYDHWSLLPNLLAKLSTDLPALTVGKILFGGDEWTQAPIDAVAAWHTKYGCPVTPLCPSCSDYHVPGTFAPPFIDIGGVQFRIVAANVPITRSALDLVRNGTSAVVNVSFGGVNAMMPGDATADTLAFMNARFKQWVTAGHAVPVVPCKVLSSPHHGALRTIASNFTSTNPKLEVAAAFSDYVQAQNVVASAGYMSHHRHPNKQVMDILGFYVRTDQAEHSYVVYDRPLKKFAQIDDAEVGKYTTVRTLTFPPKESSWMFTITSTGEIFFRLDQDEPVMPSRPKAKPRELLLADMAGSAA